MSRLSFLNVSSFFDTHCGGLERVAGQLCREISSAGYQLTWAASNSTTPKPTKLFKNTSIPCINPIESVSGLPMPIPTVSGVFKLFQAVAQSDVIIIHDTLYSLSMLAAIAAKTSGKPIILIQHIANIEFSSPLLRGLMKVLNATITRLLIKIADQVVFISNNVRRDFLKYNTKNPPQLIFNGIDSSIFYPMKPDLGRFNLPDTKPIFTFVGRFVEKKGIFVIKELALLRPDVMFVFAGSGPLAPQDWKLPNVKVLGELPEEEIAKLLASSDALLLPSVGEGYPLVIQEAMAVGIPVFCGERSASADVNAHRFITGVPVDLRQRQKTALLFNDAINKHIFSNFESSRMASYALRTYSWPKFAKYLINTGEKLLKSKGSCTDA